MTQFAEGEAPWSEDDEFAEAAKACKDRCKKFGCRCDGSDDAESEYEGQCDECMHDARETLAERHEKSAAPSVALPVKEGGT